MKKLVPALLGLVLTTATVYGQAGRLVMNGGYMVFDTVSTGNTYLVIDNALPIGITEATPGAGNIVTEREKNRIRWINAGQMGAYTVPYTTRSNVKIPLTVTKTTTGTGAVGVASMIFSTYNWKGAVAASTWNNNLYRPTDVTHMNEFANGTVNNSDNAVDRFWIIDAAEGSYLYTAKPTITMTFNYDPVGDITSGNAITAASIIGAQRFHAATDQWGDMLPQGTSIAGQVAGAVITPTNFYRSWTLASTVTPLPIQLVDWNGKCEGDAVQLSWTTASERDNAYFTIERSADATSWQELARVEGSGNSSSMLTYSYTDVSGKGLNYYRLSQTDIDGTTEKFDVIAAGCDATDGIEIVNAWDDGDDLNVVVSSTLDGIYDLTLLDAQGKVMGVKPTQVINTGVTTLKVDKGTIATGIYVVQLQNATNVMTRRVVLQ